MKQAVPQLYFKLLFLFPTHCSQQPLPRAGWPLINMEYRVLPVVAGMLQQIRCLFHLQAKEKGISGMIWIKNNCFFWQSRLDSPWAVVWWFYLHQENPSKQAALGYQDGLSFQHIFPAYQKFGSLPCNHFTEPWVESTPVVVSLFSKLSNSCFSRNGQHSLLSNKYL